MLGPFPGMDPYLEDPTLWPDLHHSFLTFARSAIRAALPPGYIARVEERVLILPLERGIIPDVFVRRRAHQPLAYTGALAVTENENAPRLIRVPPEEARREGYIEIVDAVDRERVITTVEVLSPTNKMAGSPGRASYARKQEAELNSGTHLLEIDLLRSGEPTIAAPHSALLSEGVAWDYLICLHRARQNQEDGQMYEVWFNHLRQPLPRVKVPLDGGVADIDLDLQAVLTRCYEEAGYQDVIDYAYEAYPPLSAEDAAWADTLLREHGLRV